MNEILLTQEVGSLAKPDWRVQPLNGQPVTQEHIDNAAKWAERLDLEPTISSCVLELARREATLSPTSREAIKCLAALYAVKLQEKAGIDIVYDGEQDRPEMYQVAVEGTEGFEWRGRVRAFDNKSFKKAAVIAEPSLKQPWHVDEFNRLKALTQKDIKVPITGAYTIADWSFDEYYQKRLDQGGRGLNQAEAKRAFVLDLADNVLRPNIQALVEAGAKWVQIDEPAATTKPDEVGLFVESFNRSVAGLVGKFSVHICFSDYSLLFPHISQLENCSQFSLEFANRDLSSLGTDGTNRPAYEILSDIKKFCPDSSVGLGVSSVHENEIEVPELVRDRVLRAVEILGDPEKVYPSPDCGLRTRSWDVAYRKLRAVAEGTHLAKEELG